jgi:heme exporter protein D
MLEILTIPILRHGRTDIFDAIEHLWAGDPLMWLAVGLIFACIAFFAVYQLVTGRSFVKSKAERRAARQRRQKVLWDYRRDDD